MLLTLAIVATLTFFMMHSIPGDPLGGMARELPEQTKANYYAKYGLDKPLTEQYLMYMKNLVRGDLGESLLYPGRSVTDTILSTSPVSGLAGGIALIIGLIIGIAMGITGTEVSKDAASMILTDDNFATIIKAVANGRNVYQNIRNTILFLLSGNTAGILAVLYTSLAGLPVPFVPVQLLFINLVTDSLPAIAIGVEKPGKNLLLDRPRNPEEPILNASFYKRLIFQGLLISLATLAAYYIGLITSPACACTMAFSTLTMARLFHGFSCRGSQSIFRLGLGSNPYLIAAFFTGTALLTGVLFLPFLQSLFAVIPLTAIQAGSVLWLAFLPTCLIQIKRIIYKNKF